MAKKEHSKAAKIITVLLAALLILVIGIIAFSPKQSAKYQVSSINYVVVDPQTVSVGFKVTNIGNASGTPDCTAKAQDDSYSHTGFNEGTMSGSIAPGESTASALPVTITGQGANDITSANVTCN